MFVVLAYLACAVIWGTTWFAIRVCIGTGGYPTWAAAALRFVLAAAIVGVVLALGFGRPGPKARPTWLWLGFAGLLNAVGYALVYAAEERIPGGLAAVLYGTAPLMMAILATVTRTEKVSAGALASALLSLAGVAVIFLDRLDFSAAQGTGVILILISVLVSNIYNIIIKRHAAAVHPLATSAIFMVVTMVALGALALGSTERAIPWPPATRPTLALLYLGVVGSVIAFGCYFYLLKRMRLMSLSTLVFIQPMIALGVDALWEHGAHLVTRTYIGVGITLTGVVLGVLFRARDGAPSKPAPVPVPLPVAVANMAPSAEIVVTPALASPVVASSAEPKSASAVRSIG